MQGAPQIDTRGGWTDAPEFRAFPVYHPEAEPKDLLYSCTPSIGTVSAAAAR